MSAQSMWELASACVYEDSGTLFDATEDELALQHGASLHVLLSTCNPDGTFTADTNPTSSSPTRITTTTTTSTSTGPAPSPTPPSAAAALCPRVVHLPGARHEYAVLPPGEEEGPSPGRQRGLLVSRLPIRNLTKIPSLLLPLLARQLLFNRLYQSVFGPPTVLPPLPAHKQGHSKAHTNTAPAPLAFGVRACSPSSLSVTVQQGKWQDWVLAVALDASCRLAVNWVGPAGSNLPPPSSPAAATAALHASYSLPAVIHNCIGSTT
jgi:hypothetical protein